LAHKNLKYSVYTRFQFFTIPFIIHLSLPHKLTIFILVVFFLLGDSPGIWILCADVSEHYLFQLHRWCRKEEFLSCFRR